MKTLWYRLRCACWLWWETASIPSPLWCWTYAKSLSGNEPREDVRTEVSYAHE